MAARWQVLVCKCRRGMPLCYHPASSGTSLTDTDITRMIARGGKGQGWAIVDGDWRCPPCLDRWMETASQHVNDAAQLVRIEREAIEATRKIEVR